MEPQNRHSRCSHTGCQARERPFGGPGHQALRGTCPPSRARSEPVLPSGAACPCWGASCQYKHLVIAHPLISRPFWDSSLGQEIQADLKVTPLRQECVPAWAVATWRRSTCGACSGFVLHRVFLCECRCIRDVLRGHWLRGGVCTPVGSDFREPPSAWVDPRASK